MYKGLRQKVSLTRIRSTSFEAGGIVPSQMKKKNVLQKHSFPDYDYVELDIKPTLAFPSLTRTIVQTTLLNTILMNGH